MTALHKELHAVVASYHSEYTRSKNRLETSFRRYVNLPQERQSELRALEGKKRQIQRDAFLGRFLIAKHKISEIGPAREAMLISYGVETASDITASKVKSIPGFKHHLYNMLKEWRQSCERRFVYDTSKPIPPTEIDALNKRMTNLKLQLQEEHRSRTRSMVDMGNKTRARVADLNAELEASAREFKQAEADAQVFGI